MNIKKLLLIILIIGVVIGVGYVILQNVSEVTDIKNLDFEYIDSLGNNHKHYKIECNKKCVATIKTDKIKDELSHEIDKKTINKLVEICNRYYVRLWNGFNESRSNTNVGSFSFKMTIQDNKEIEAKGYMKYPLYFTKAIQAMDKVFEEEFKEDIKTD